MGRVAGRTDADFYTALYRVARAINSSLDEEEVLRLIARSVSEAMGVKGCAIRLLSPAKERLDLIAAYGLSDEYLSKGTLRPELSTGVSEALEGRPVVAYVDEPERWQYPEEARREGIAASLTVPLIVDGTPVGILRLYAADRRRFPAREIEFVSALADLSALAIKNARRHHEVQQDYELLSQYTFGSYQPIQPSSEGSVH